MSGKTGTLFFAQLAFTFITGEKERERNVDSVQKATAMELLKRIFEE